jgi:hypothetical protein
MPEHAGRQYGRFMLPAQVTEIRSASLMSPTSCGNSDPPADSYRPRGSPTGRRADVTGTAAARKVVSHPPYGLGAGAGPGGSLDGPTMHRIRTWCLLFVCVRTTGTSEGEGKVHGLARGGAIVTPTAGQAGD